MSAPIVIAGCRHDILGHNLKAIGLLRALAVCAEESHCDREAEGWWDLENGSFNLRSTKFSTADKLVEFFAKHYQPTRVLSAWNKHVGLAAGSAEKYALSEERAHAVVTSAKVQAGELTVKEAFTEVRERGDVALGEALDAVSSCFLDHQADNPVFLKKGASGRAQAFRSYWSFADDFTRARSAGRAADLAADSLFGQWSFAQAQRGIPGGRGTPFFPDAFKTYNRGLSWKVETFPFSSLDYLLAAEGAFALRGSVARTLAANSRRFAAFPFLFDTGEDQVSYTGETTGISAALWLPLWNRAASYRELASFIADAQARLPRRDAHFSSEFARALQAQGVDAGFVGWQEFRFKMRGSDVPWPCTGRYLSSTNARRGDLVTRALGPLDESGFLDQFEVRREKGKISAKSPHTLRAAVNAAIEETAANPTAENALETLVEIFAVCRRMAESKSLRKLLPGEPVFFAPLPMAPWEELLGDLDEPGNDEFLIARALASITGLRKQRGVQDKRSEAQPMLGSILPLKCGLRGWYLPTDSQDRSHQAVWTGSDLSHDLARVLARRYLDSLKDDFPALASPRPAPLASILRFLNGDLDDHRIARWTEALSLIGWHFKKWRDEANSMEEQNAPDAPGALEGTAIPLAYAALRSLLDIESEWEKPPVSDDAPGEPKHRRSQRPFSLAAQRSRASVALAVEDALHWLAVWGVPNPYGPEARAEKPRLAGRDIVRARHLVPDATIVERLAAAVCIPLRRDDRFALFRQITLPQTTHD